MNKTRESQEYSNANNRPEHTVRGWDSGAYSDTPNPLVTVIERNANSEAVATPMTISTNREAVTTAMSISTSSCESGTGTARDNIH